MDQILTPEFWILFLALSTLITGFYLTFRGLPYHSNWSGVHIIVTIILIASYIMVAYPKISEMTNPVLTWILFWISIALIFLSLISGVVVVNFKNKVSWLIWSHRIFPIAFFIIVLFFWFK